MNFLQSKMFKAIGSQLAVLGLLLFATAANAQFSSSGGDIGFVTTLLGKPWLKNLITAGFAIATLLEIFQRWRPIFEGSDVLKNLSVITAYVAMTIWWADLLKAVLSPGG